MEITRFPAHNVGSSVENLDMTIAGWVISAVVVSVAYQQFPSTRGFIAGVILLIALGIILRFESTITGQFKEIMTGGN